MKESYRGAVSTFLNRTASSTGNQLNLSLYDWQKAYIGCFGNAATSEGDFNVSKFKKDIKIELRITDEDTFMIELIEQVVSETPAFDTKLFAHAYTFLDNEDTLDVKMKHVVAVFMYTQIEQEFRAIYEEKYREELLQHLLNTHFSREYKKITTEGHFIVPAHEREEHLLTIGELFIVDDFLEVVIDSFWKQTEQLKRKSLAVKIGDIEWLEERLLMMEEVFYRVSFIRGMTDAIYSKHMTALDIQYIEELTMVWKQLMKRSFKKTVEVNRAVQKIYEKMV